MIVINISLIDHICDQLIFDQHNRDQLVKINIFLINIIVVVMYQRNGFIDKVWMYQLLMGVPSDDSNGSDDSDDDNDDSHDDDNYRRSGSIDKVWMYQLLMCVPS